MELLRPFKRNTLKAQIVKIEAMLTARKIWGNNITTLVILNELIEDNILLYRNQVLIEMNEGITLNSSFRNFQEMVDWISNVKNLFDEMQSTSVTEIPPSFSDLNIQSQLDVDWNRFINDSNGYPFNLPRLITHMRKKLVEINRLYLNLSTNKRQYLNMRLQNGLMTVLIIHELILEQMANGK